MKDKNTAVRTLNPDYFFSQQIKDNCFSNDPHKKTACNNWMEQSQQYNQYLRQFNNAKKNPVTKDTIIPKQSDHSRQFPDWFTYGGGH